LTDSVYVKNFERYLEDAKHVSKNTLLSYVRDINQFEKFLEREKLSGFAGIKQKQAEGYITWLKKNGKSVSTISRSIASLRCFYRYLYTLGLVKDNPIDNIMPDKQQKKLPQILTGTEVDKLLDQPDKKDAKGYRDKAY
jgi:integrase/recombinase XerD